jgi:hypothetical protein
MVNSDCEKEIWGTLFGKEGMNAGHDTNLVVTEPPFNFYPIRGWIGPVWKFLSFFLSFFSSFFFPLFSPSPRPLFLRSTERCFGFHQTDSLDELVFEDFQFSGLSIVAGERTWTH